MKIRAIRVLNLVVVDLAEGSDFTMMFVVIK